MDQILQFYWDTPGLSRGVPLYFGENCSVTVGLHISLEIIPAGAVIPHFDIIKWYLHLALPYIQSLNMQHTPHSLLSWVSSEECIVSHYNDIIMSEMVSQITSLTIVYWTVYLGADQRKHQSSASLAIVQEIHWWECFHLMMSTWIWIKFILYFTSLFQCLWRCYAAEPRSNFHATWRIHMQDHPSRHHPNAFSKVARRASIIKQKRRISKGRFDLAGLGNHIGDRKDSEASVMFLPDEHRPSTGRSFNMRASCHGNAFCITGPFVGGIHWSRMDSPHKGPAV